MNITKVIRDSSLKIRLIVSFLTIILTSLSVLGGLNYYFSNKGFIDVSSSYNQQLVGQVCRNIDLYFSQIMSITDSLASDPNIKYYGKYFKTVDTNKTIDDIKLTLFNATITKSDIDDINFIYNENLLISLFNMYDMDSLQSIYRYYDLEKIYLKSRVVPIVNINRNNVKALSCIKSVYIPGELDNVKYLIIVNFSLKNIEEMLSEIKLGKGSGTYILDRNGNIQYSSENSKNLYSNMESFIRKMNFSSANSSIINIDGNRYLLSINPLQNSNLYVLVYNPLENLIGASKSMGRMVIIVLVICALWAVVLSVMLSSTFTRPLAKLVFHMAKISEGNLLTITKAKGSIEIQILYSKFNEMIEKINALLEDVDDKNKLKRKAELYALQSQINPHFLYNTLGSINSMAILTGSRDIMKMTTSLAKLLRLSISKGKELVTIDDEIQHVKCYLDIQEIRYKDKFRAVFEIDESVLQFNIVRLILQPLVENAIYHGLELKEGKGTITIKVFKTDNKIKLEVIDDGLGIDDEKMVLIEKNLRLGIVYGENRSIGIYNVNERLKLYYGDEYGLRFYSGQDTGTKVEMLIPQFKEAEKND